MPVYPPFLLCPRPCVGTAELEAALNSAEEVSESAVIGFPHDVKGEGIGCFVILKEGYEPSEKLSEYAALRLAYPTSNPNPWMLCYRTLKRAVRKAISPIATPDFIVYSDLPKV